MPFTETPFRDLLIFEPRVFEDDRGYFYEAYNLDTCTAAGVDYRFVQDNQSFSGYGVIRGLHYQLQPYAQCKLVRALTGRILDIAVDIRKGSPTYGRHFAIELSAENKKQLLIPPGFAHGFSVLSDTATVLYKCDNLYHKEQEAGIIYNDPSLDIDWRIPEDKVIVSQKDQLLPVLEGATNNFTW
ncbi:dTDP-4-dehydrorhamnose 3,5-epimerase [Niabella terrae]